MRDDGRRVELRIDLAEVVDGERQREFLGFTHFTADSGTPDRNEVKWQEARTRLRRRYDLQLSNETKGQFINDLRGPLGLPFSAY